MNPRIQILLGSTIIALAATSAQAANITIMPVGDSITAGFSSQMSFREELDARLAASGCTFISRGSVSNDGYQGAGPHEGYPGDRAEQFINGNQPPNPGIGAILDNDFAIHGNYPEVLLLNIGTNDVIRGIEQGDTLTQTVNTTVSEIAQLISTIHGKDPNIEIFLGNLVPLYADDTDGDGDLDNPSTLVENHPFADALSDALESAYLNTTVPGVHLVDLRTGYRSTDMVSDGVHPSPDNATNPESDSGEHRLAVAIAAALEEEGLCAPTGTDNSFPLTDILTPTIINGGTFTGSISFTGRAFDTGGAGFISDGNGPAPRVTIAIQDNATNLYFDIANNGGFGSFVSTDASLTNPSANFVNWSTPSVTLPDGDYTLFALAIDDDGQQNFFGAGNQWPERIQFFIQGNGGGNGGNGSGGGPLFQEAEAGTLFGDMTITNDAGVSNGQFVEVPGAGAVDDFFAHYVEFSVTIETAGNYQINAGVRGPAGNQNSFFAQIDEDPRYEWHIPQNNQLLEDLVSDRVNSNDIDVIVTLSAGVHTLRVFGREEGAQLDWIEFEPEGGGAGNVCNGLTVTVDLANGDSPTAGDDVIWGTGGADVINALAGDDTICSNGGDDIINAGGGVDWIDGGPGNDDIVGGGGADMIFGGDGDDIIMGGGGNDDIEGEAGDDSLFGQTGNDTLDGGDGIDAISGGGGSDTIATGTGATVGSGVFVAGGAGADTIIGGPDADDIRGGAGPDIINGNDGDDVITGGVGRDVIDGGAGDDDIRGQESRDTIDGGSGSDLISGGGGDDTLIGGDSPGDVCNGQAGVDTAAASCETTISIP